MLGLDISMTGISSLSYFAAVALMLSVMFAIMGTSLWLLLVLLLTSTTSGFDKVI